MTICELESLGTLDNRFLEIERLIKRYSLLIKGICSGKISEKSYTLEILSSLSEQAILCEATTLSIVATSCKTYIEEMSLDDSDNLVPLKEGLILMESLFRHLKTGKEFNFEISEILEQLDVNSSPEKKGSILNWGDGSDQSQSNNDDKITDEDLELMNDFVVEAEENLDSIEINLIELEKDPSNEEIINNIFRPFHTIKGVSGFLSLEKINKLSHVTENLLDNVRSGQFQMNDMTTNVILESVDLLKVLVTRIKSGINHGIRHQDDDIDIDRLSEKLQNLQNSNNVRKELIGEILVRKGIVNKQTIDKSIEIQRKQPQKKIGEILVEEEKVSSEDIASALIDQNSTKQKVAVQVKVDTEKLDNLVDHAGELVIAQSMLRQQAKDSSLYQSITQFGQIVTNIQNIAMSMRMIPIKTTFMKMIRLVRDLSHKTCKNISLNMVGEETEIDRNLVDALYEPMVHMIRNAVDHGIESEAKRISEGKDPKGNITLRAYHRSGQIVIEIEDDGKGLDRETILKKAIKKGLALEEEKLTDTQIYNFILHPGFSTTETISDVSGRGVGMDVVKDGIEKFRGLLNIESIPHKGTKFTINLPLTLAIIDGMLVRIGDEKYVIPTTAIHRAFKPDKRQYFTLKKEGEFINERDQLIPIIHLNKMFNIKDSKEPVWNRLAVVVKHNDEYKAILVDELLGKDEYVIKNLGSGMESLMGFAGGAILSDGKVGLILDINGIFDFEPS